MPLLGSAAVAMWWNVAPADRAEFEDWHSHEHFPERMRIPGFRRGSRWAALDGGEGFFVMYELDAYETLTSPHYLARLNDPTPWSSKMMPRHRDMVRSQCRVMDSYGGGIAGFVMTVRLSPASGREEGLRNYLRSSLGALATRAGTTGGHLLLTQTPEAAATREQQIRGGDRVADWIVIAAVCEAQSLSDLAQHKLGPVSLQDAGATGGSTISHFRLAHAVTPNDL
jgi:hypothetical protein